MTFVGFAGIFFSLAALLFSSVRITLPRFLLSLALLAMHGAACLAYYLYVQNHVADTRLYYYDPYNFAHGAFGFGTIFAVKFVQFLKHEFGATYLDCFVLFQSFGFLGVMVLMRLFQEVQLKCRSESFTMAAYLLFLPSIHFWTAAIGKDAPLFLAVTLCLWSLLNLRRRVIGFLVAIAIMVLFRAHIALITLISLAAAAALHRRTAVGQKALLVTAIGVGAYLLVGSVQSTVNVNVSDVGSVSTFLADKSSVTGSLTGSTSVGSSSFPIRLMSLLFRPFFFDAVGIPGLIASVENIGSLFLFGYFLWNWRRMYELAREVFFINFAVVFSVVLIVLLSVISYNVGLGLRERVMVLPALLSAFIALWATRPHVLARKRAPSALSLQGGTGKAVAGVSR